MPGAVIKSGASVKYSIIAENVVVENGAVIGEDPAVCNALDWGITVICEGLTVGKDAVVGAKKMITESVREGEKL